MDGVGPGLITTRPMTVDDVPAVHALGDRYMARMQGRPFAVTPEGLAAQLDLPGRELAVDVPVVEIDGRLVAFGSVWAGPPYHEIVMSVLVDDDLDDAAATEVRHVLVDAALGAARHRDLTLGPDPARRACLVVQEKDSRLAAAAQGTGFALERESLLMAIDQRVVTVPDTGWPAGIEVRAVSPDDGPLLAEISRDAFADHPGDNDFDEEQMSAYLLEPSTRLDLSAVALDAEGPVGMLLCDEQTDGGYVNMLGVRERGRERGLGSALLRHAFRVFAAEGRPVVRLHVELDNPTGAVGVYESVGMSRAATTQTWTHATS